MNKDKLLEKINSELKDVREELKRADAGDDAISYLIGWQLALEWTIKEINGINELDKVSA